MVIPRSLLNPLKDDETEEDRKNLRLYSENSTVDVDIYLVDSSDSQEKNLDRKRITMDVKSRYGSVTTRVVGMVIQSVFSMSDIQQHKGTASLRKPFYLHAEAPNGSVHVRVPSSFRGLVTVYTVHGSVKFSNTLHAKIATFNEVQNVRRWFIGDLTGYDEETEWSGDEVNILAENGSVKLRYSDEAQPDSLISRMFSFMS